MGIASLRLSYLLLYGRCNELWRVVPLGWQALNIQRSELAGPGDRNQFVSNGSAGDNQRSGL